MTDTTMSCAAAGRRGGLATLAKLGKAHFVTLSRLGMAARAARLTPQIRKRSTG